MKPSAAAIIDKKRILLNNGRLLQVGALVYRFQADELGILLITSRRRKRWIVPKGWPMPGKTLPQAALQEAYEEAGVHGAVEPRASGHYTYEKPDRPKRKNNRFEVEVFAVSFSHQEQNWPERQQRTYEWLTPPEAARRVDEPGLKEIILGFSRPQQPFLPAQAAAVLKERKH